jgi:hypothetical protein
MNWDRTWDAVATLLEADADITAVVGSAIYLDGERPYAVPSMTATLVVDTEGEVWAPADWQLDVYARTMTAVTRVERAIRRILDGPAPIIEVDGVGVLTRFLAGRTTRGPETDQWYHRSLDFRLEPVRALYHPAADPEEE